ncbi:MAG: HAMP domain-containing histidine kinase [Bacillaceae bacterium]|nr:HAMP domain-containing histidine kinase [Bacillaceae bacterium]
MRFNRIDVKLGLTMISIFILVLLPTGFVIDQVFCNFYYNKAREEAHQLSANYARILASDKGYMSTHMIDMASEITQTKIFLLNQHGQMVSYTGIEGMVFNITDDELRELSKGNPVDNEYVEPLTDTPYLMYGHPIIVEESFYGGVFILLPLDDMYESLNTVRQLLVLAGFGGVFLALAFTFVASRKLSSPLLEMEKATQLIAKGNLDTNVMVRSNDEIGSLARGINNLTKELKRYHDTRSEFFASISHELKTPISYLVGYSQVLKEKLYQTEEEKDKYLSTLEHEATRINHLISDLFDLSKMKEGKFEINKEWIDLTEIAENLKLKYSLIAKEKGITFHFAVDENIPLFYGDGQRIDQILTNLLDNAMRYTKEGQVKLSLEQSNENKVIMVISDTGSGIPPKELPFIFERFYRVEKSRSREYGGTGLGLAIVKMLVELHHGTIRVTSKEMEGTQFVITFPVDSRETEGGEGF